jgi:hypothetical protein
MCVGFWCESLKEKEHLKDQGIDGIKMDLGDWLGGCGVD